MKTLKCMSLILLVLGLCSSQVQAQDCGANVSIGAFFYDGDAPVSTVHIDDEIYYAVTVRNCDTCYPFVDGDPNLLLPDKTTRIVLDTGVSAPLGEFVTKYYSYNYTDGVYTVDIADMDPVAHTIVAEAFMYNTCVLEAGTARGLAYQPFPILVVSNPCTEVTITAIPPAPYAPGDPVAPGTPIDLVVTEYNCGEDPIHDVSIEVKMGDTVIATLTPLTAIQSDTDDDILQVGETMIWDATTDASLNDIVITEPTTFTATGTGLDPLDNVVTWCIDEGNPPEGTICSQAEQALVPVDTSCPEPCINIGKSVDCGTSKVGDTVTYTICIENCGELYNLTNVQVTDPQLGDGPLAGFPDTLTPGQEVCVDFPYTIQPEDDPGDIPDNFGNTLVNQAHVSAIDDCDGETVVEKDSEEVSVLLVHPCLDVQVECISTGPVLPGELAEFRVTTTNCGDVDLLVDIATDWGICEETGTLLEAFSDPIVCESSVLVPADFVGTQFCLEVVADWDIADDLEGCLTNEGTIVETGCCDIGQEGCRLTGGGVDEEYSDEGVSAKDFDGDRATFGGQAGANTALPPQPKGEWTHHQQKGPSGSFIFHGGTASAPLGTEVIEIRCSDPGGCKPSGDPPSPAKQVDFDGIGTFKNFGTKDRAPVWLIPGATAECSSKGGKFRFDGTFHYFQVNADDLGEPGNKQLDATSDPDTCPPNGFGEKGDLLLGDCQCADFYRITIYDGVKAADVKWLDDTNIDLTSLNTTDVIYEFHGYIDGGNLQIHHLTGYDLNQPVDGVVSLKDLASNWLDGV